MIYISFYKNLLLVMGKSIYIYNMMEEEYEISCIVILFRSSYDIDVVMLDEEISNFIF